MFVVSSIYELMENSENETHQNERVNIFFDIMDLNKDGVVSEDEFFAVCKKVDKKCTFKFEFS